MTVTASKGFVAGGLACGIKHSGAPDLALVATDDHTPVPAAAVFTSNLAQAAPVQISRAHLADGHATAVILNSGNANAATGDPGRRDARRMCELAGHGLASATADVLVCSTGLIGIPMPMSALETGIPNLCDTLTATGGADAAHAILTTDTVAKEATASAANTIVGGMAKGAAMLSPAMATMLAVLTTDAAVEPHVLQPALARAVSETFDCLSVDGCRSTNDTVIVLASGRAGTVDNVAFIDALTEVCGSLAEQMAQRRRRRHQVRASTRRRRAHTGGGPRRGPRRREQPTGPMFTQRRRPVLGSCPVRARCERSVHRPRNRRHLLQRRHRLPRRCCLPARHQPSSAEHMAGREIHIGCDLRLAHGRPPYSPRTSRTPTSTRTGGPREQARNMSPANAEPNVRIVNHATAAFAGWES